MGGGFNASPSRYQTSHIRGTTSNSITGCFFARAGTDTLKDPGSLIVTIRNQKVIVDRDLAEIYGVETRRRNEQVKRNPDRFPEDFMFQLTKEEAAF